MANSKIEELGKVLNSILVGDICKGQPFDESAAKIYLDGAVKEMPEVFSDRDLMVRLIRDIALSEDIIIDISYCLAHGIPASGDVHEVVNMAYYQYCHFIDRIVWEYGDKRVKSDKDVLREVLGLYRDKSYGLSELCYDVPHEVLMDDDIFNMVLYIGEPAEIYNRLLSDEEKKDKAIVCRLLDELKNPAIVSYEESFGELCTSVPGDILMDEAVRSRLFAVGIPSVIYEEILTDEERLNDGIIYELLKIYKNPCFSNWKNDFKKLKELWAEAILSDFRNNEYAGKILELNEPEVAEEFFGIVDEFLYNIKEFPNIDQEMQEFLRKMARYDYGEHREEWERHIKIRKHESYIRGDLKKEWDGNESSEIPELQYIMTCRPYYDSFNGVLKPYMYQFMLFDDVEDGNFSHFDEDDNDDNASKTVGQENDEQLMNLNLPDGSCDDIPF